MTVVLIGLIVVTVAFTVTAAATPVLRTMAMSAGWVDSPDGTRKRHERPVPSLGGLAMALGLVAGLIAICVASGFFGEEVWLPRPMFWVGAAIMLLLGVLDDVRGVGFKRKFCVQLFVAYLLLHAGYRIDVSVLPFVGADPYDHALISIPLTIFWIVGVINAVNLLDGLDGLAGGVVLIAFASFAVIFGYHDQTWLVLVGLAICGPLAAFLLYNFRPASIFMGDSGSLLLGYLVAMFALTGRGHWDLSIALLIPIVALGVPLMDTLVSMMRRALAGRSVFAPDHDHVHHRLMRRLDERRAVLVLYGWSILLGAAAVWMSRLPVQQALVVLGGTIVLVLGFVYRLGYVVGHAVEAGPMAAATSEKGNTVDVRGRTATTYEHASGTGDGAAGPEGVPTIIHSKLSSTPTETAHR